MSEQAPIKFETFRDLDSYGKRQLTLDKPSCFNGYVKIRRYRFTVEQIPESDDVLYARLLDLWHASDNHHHWAPLKSAAREIGRTLPSDEFGTDRKPQP